MNERTLLPLTKETGVKPSLRFFELTVMNLMVGLAMASLWGMFAYRHLLAFHTTGEWTYLLIFVSESFSATFFIFRSTPKTVSKDPLDWLFGIAGTLIPLFFSPAAWGLLPIAKIAIVIGFVLQILGVISLNRSLAIVAAKREIKTKGMYRFVRHPLYASYLLIFTGYMLANTTWTNFAIYAMTMGLLYIRLQREEKHLSLEPMYAQYMRSVRYRIIPFVF